MLGAFKVECMDRRATLITAAGVIAPAADEEALWFLMKLDQSRHGDNERDAGRGPLR